MLIVFGFGIIVAILIGSPAAMIHASGYAPVGLVSIGVGAALGLKLLGHLLQAPRGECRVVLLPASSLAHTGIFPGFSARAGA